MNLPILTYPNDILRKKAEEIKDPKDPEIKQLILDMIETMEKSGNALGLAAPQVGKMVRLCIIKLEGKTHILVNPVIKSKSIRKEMAEEGCLSFPGKFIPIKRSKKVTVKLVNRHGEKITIKAEGLLARAFQHEIDHLDGLLIIDKENKN
ncbi:MAG TPA: peptide deformylase [Candidatus Moranbacteria bacterium]|nr:peptide deformylase [Candidatus Moranbacteria bacterium]